MFVSHFCMAFCSCSCSTHNRLLFCATCTSIRGFYSELLRYEPSRLIAGVDAHQNVRGVAHLGLRPRAADDQLWLGLGLGHEGTLREAPSPNELGERPRRMVVRVRVAWRSLNNSLKLHDLRRGHEIPHLPAVASREAALELPLRSSRGVDRTCEVEHTPLTARDVDREAH